MSKRKKIETRNFYEWMGLVSTEFILVFLISKWLEGFIWFMKTGDIISEFFLVLAMGLAGTLAICLLQDFSGGRYG